jgi:hypothetical protein
MSDLYTGMVGTGGETGTNRRVRFELPEAAGLSGVCEGVGREAFRKKACGNKLAE